VEYLASIGVRTNLPNRWKNTAERESDMPIFSSFKANPLIQASNGNIEFFQSMTKSALKELILNPPKNPLNNTILHLASKNGHVDLVTLILDNGGKSIIDSINLNKNTALHFACAHNHPTIVKLLLDNSADMFRLNHWGFTCFQEAGNYGRESVLKMFDSLFPVTDEHKEAESGHLKYFKFRWYYQFRLPFDVNIPDKDGKTFLYRSAKGGQLELFL
jgi:ankyrin repeat protein